MSPVGQVLGGGEKKNLAYNSEYVMLLLNSCVFKTVPSVFFRDIQHD